MRSLLRRTIGRISRSRVTGPVGAVRSPTTTLQIVYVVVPHPDDEFEAWALVEDSADNYPVFVLCTHGEWTSLADGHGYQGGLGERLPQPQPWGRPGSSTVRAQRLDSWHAFLDGMADLDPHLDRGLVHAGDFDDGPSRFSLWVGERSARVVFDGGDGRLTPEFVTAALQRTRALRRTHLPVQREYAVVGAAYLNVGYRGFRYAHPDHRAVHEALWHTDQGVPGPQWCRTATADPDVVRTRGRTEHVSSRTYAAVMGLAPDGRRTGLQQVVYGWLAPSGGWPVGETDATTMWSREQAFWRRYG